jgi:hypothetical protein
MRQGLLRIQQVDAAHPPPGRVLCRGQRRCALPGPATARYSALLAGLWCDSLSAFLRRLHMHELLVASISPLICHLPPVSVSLFGGSSDQYRRFSIALQVLTIVGGTTSFRNFRWRTRSFSADLMRCQRGVFLVTLQCGGRRRRQRDQNGRGCASRCGMAGRAIAANDKPTIPP